MKKILFSLVCSFAFFQSAQAITSPINQSISVYQSILNAINPLAVIPQNEYIVEIKRVTKSFELGNEIHYLIKTASVDTINLNAESEDKGFDMRCRKHHKLHQNTHRYDVVVSVTANPVIGPPIVQVISITPQSTHTSIYYGEAAAII